MGTTYSRISKFQQQKAVRQSVMFIIFTLIAIAIFVFALLPAAIRIVDTLGKRTPLLKENTDLIPPQTPILFPTPDATYSAELSFSGYAQADTTVTLYNNGIRVQEVVPNTDGQFIFSSITLGDGENELYVVSRTEQNAEATSKTHLVVLDTKPPTLTITTPQDKTTITRRREQSIQVSGTTEPKVRVFLQDKLLLTNNQGVFSGMYQLAEGDNQLKFRAVDPAGNSVESMLTVSFHP